VGVAEGCAIGGLRVTVGSAAPRRQGEMVVVAMHPDSAGIEQALTQVGQRVAQFAELVARHKAEMARLTSQPEVRGYLQLAARVRKNEITLTPEQLKAIAKLSQDIKTLEAEQQTGMALLAQLGRQQGDSAAVCVVDVRQVLGETQVRALAFRPDGSSIYDLPAREVKARLRGASPAAALFAGSSGAFAWRSDQGGGAGLA
jgi:hypothetical protein